MTVGDRVRYIGDRLFTHVTPDEGVVFRMPLAAARGNKDARVAVLVGQSQRLRYYREADLEVIA